MRKRQLVARVASLEAEVETLRGTRRPEVFADPAHISIGDLAFEGYVHALIDDHMDGA